VSGESPGLVTIVEDDAAIAEGLALNLGILKYQTEVVADGEIAPRRIEESRPDLVLLDISLPRQSGIWVLEQLRGSDNHVPVIVLSARQDEFDKVAALRLGADDYVTKPFALAELLARVDAVLRRSRRSAERVAASARPAADRPVDAGPEGTGARRALLTFGDVTIDLDSRTVNRGGTPVRLTHLEFELLTFLCQSDRRVFSRTQLLREVWGGLQAGRARTVDNFMAQLRAKLESDPDNPKHLLTVRGSGYRFEG
jgi:two-component system, OmpR family, alkaline phosphatase synthesis response regulator PhoP